MFCFLSDVSSLDALFCFLQVQLGLELIHSSRSYLDDYYFQREMTTADLLLFSYLEEDRWFACSRFFAEDGFQVGWWLLCYRVAPQQLLFKDP